MTATPAVVLAKLAKRPRIQHALLARYEDFEKVFEAAVTVKARKKIHNSAIALRVMAELALERLAQLEDVKP